MTGFVLSNQSSPAAAFSSCVLGLALDPGVEGVNLAEIIFSQSADKPYVGVVFIGKTPLALVRVLVT